MTSSHAQDDGPVHGPAGATAALVLSDGSVLWGRGIGATGQAGGEVVFNTGMSGYQEVMTDPSYAGQIITFTFPHIGNVGTNDEDIESITPAARGCVLRADITEPSSWRAGRHLNDWLVSHGLVGITGVDTRRLTRRIRDVGAPNGVVAHNPDGVFDLSALTAKATGLPSLNGLDLAKDVTCAQTYTWDETRWSLATGYGTQSAPHFHVVAIDYGAKRNILRSLASHGCKVTVVPASTDFETIMGHQPDGIFLSNGPGDPAATGAYAVPVVQKLVSSDIPVFGICLGHQILALALGARTYKMDTGHRGANHPVKDHITGKVEITSQNHGFGVDRASLPAGVLETHTSLFDGTVEGLAVEGKRVFSVQYHPEASPGPQDSQYLFARFVAHIEASKG